MKYASTTIENDGTTYPDQTGWALYVIKRILDCFFAADALNDVTYWSLDSTRSTGNYDYKGYNYIYSFGNIVESPVLCAFITGNGGEHLCVYSICRTLLTSENGYSGNADKFQIYIQGSGSVPNFPVVPTSNGIIYSKDDFTIIDKSTYKVLSITENTVVMPFDSAKKIGNETTPDSSLIHADYNKVSNYSILFGIDNNVIMSLFKYTGLNLYKISASGNILRPAFGTENTLCSIFIPFYSGTLLFDREDINRWNTNATSFIDYNGKQRISSDTNYLSQSVLVNPGSNYKDIVYTTFYADSAQYNIKNGAKFMGFIDTKYIRIVGISEGNSIQRYHLFNGGNFIYINGPDVSGSTATNVVIAWDASNPIPT